MSESSRSHIRDEMRFRSTAIQKHPYTQQSQHPYHALDRPTCVEVLGAFFGHEGAVKQALTDALEGRQAAVDSLARWYRAGHAHGALAVLRVCTLPSRTHTARCEVPSLAKNALERFAELVLGTLGKFVDTDLSTEQITLATAPLWAGGLGFQALLHPQHSFPYAASVLLARAMLAARGITLDL